MVIHSYSMHQLLNRKLAKFPAILDKFSLVIYTNTTRTPIGWGVVKSIGGGNRGPGGPCPLLNLRPLYRIVIFAIENHFSLAKWPPLLSVASSASGEEP